MADTELPTALPHVDDLLPLVAVGVVAADDRLIAERHLATCQRCRDELASFHAAAAALGNHALRAPRADLWESIERALPDPGAFPSPGSAAARPLWFRWAGLAAAVAAGLLVGVAAALLVSGESAPTPLESIQRVQTDDVVFTLATVAPDSSAAGRIFMNQARTEGVVAVTGLAPLPATERYTVWIVRADEVRIPAGTFIVDSEGSAVAPLVLPDLQYDWAESGRYVALSISRTTVDRPGMPVGGPILVGPLY